MNAAPILDDAGLYTSAEVCAWLRHDDVTWFYRNRAKLERKHGFPGPVSPVGQPRWSGAALNAWSRRGASEVSTRRQAGGNVLDLRTEKMRLAARPAAGASSGR